MKKISCVGLAILLLLCAFPLAVSADGIDLPPIESVPYRYELRDGAAVITGFNGQPTDTELVIPEKVGTYPVKEIKAGAFRGVSNLMTIRLPDGLVTIGDNAFSDCTQLFLTSIPETVATIGKEAFSGCIMLHTFRIPASVTTVGENVFKGCTSLTTVNCVANAKPSGWNANWLGGCSATTNWGYRTPHHRLKHVFGTEASCQSEGVKEHYHCEECDKFFSDRAGSLEMLSVTIPKLAHVAGDWEITKPATKTETGESVRKCTACGEVLEKKTLPMLSDVPHDVPTDVIRGDLNGDGKLDAADCFKARRAFFRLTSLTPEQLAVIDLNGNGQVDAAECLKLTRAFYGLTTF